MLREYLGKDVEVQVDRPLGSLHPKYGFCYPVNYGYIPHTQAGDGEEIDAYILGEYKPLETYRGKVIGVIHRKNDNEDKLVIANQINRYSREQISALTEFQERYFDTEIVCYDYVRKSVRPTAKGLVRRKNEILAIEVKHMEGEESYYHLPGGAIEFREKSSVALRREFQEELNAEIVDMKYLCTIENLFTLDTMKAHEIQFVYEVILPGEFYVTDEFLIADDVYVSKARWVDKEEFITNKKILYPKGLKAYL